MALTIGRLAEETSRLINGGDIGLAATPSLPELKIALGQAINAALKADYFQTNLQLGESIPNGCMLGTYDGIVVTTSNGKSRCALPIKPVRLPRGMGVFSVFPKYTTDGDYEYDKEFIPLQMGQAGLLKSQRLLNDLLGQVGYEENGGELVFTKDIKSLFPDVVIGMKLVIMDVSQYGDWDVLPLTADLEWQVKMEVVKAYSNLPIGDRLVDSTSKENKGVPLNQQKQS